MHEQPAKRKKKHPPKKGVIGVTTQVADPSLTVHKDYTGDQQFTLTANVKKDNGPWEKVYATANVGKEIMEAHTKEEVEAIVMKELNAKIMEELQVGMAELPVVSVSDPDDAGQFAQAKLSDLIVGKYDQKIVQKVPFKPGVQKQYWSTDPIPAGQGKSGHQFHLMHAKPASGKTLITSTPTGLDIDALKAATKHLPKHLKYGLLYGGDPDLLNQLTKKPLDELDAAKAFQSYYTLKKSIEGAGKAAGEASNSLSALGQLFMKDNSLAMFKLAFRSGRGKAPGCIRFVPVEGDGPEYLYERVTVMPNVVDTFLKCQLPSKTGFFEVPLHNLEVLLELVFEGAYVEVAHEPEPTSAYYD